VTIRFRNVVKTFRTHGVRKVILRKLDLTLPRRNIAVLGGNGAGKSTLLRLIAGADRPDSGAILREGRVSWPLGFAGSFNGSLTGLENARFVARIYGEDTERVIGFVEEFAELGESFRMPFTTYSSGMRARLAFGVSMAFRFDWYLVDEITEVGDTSFREKCRTVFKERMGHARMIMVSHGLGSLRSYCDMGIVLDRGEVLVFDDLEDAIAYHEANMRGAKTGVLQAAG